MKYPKGVRKGSIKCETCLPFGDVVATEYAHDRQHTLKIHTWHYDDIERIWHAVGTGDFLSRQIVPSIPSKVLNEYKNRGYLNSTRPIHGVTAYTRVWKLTPNCVKVCRRNFGESQYEKPVEEVTKDNKQEVP